MRSRHTGWDSPGSGGDDNIPWCSCGHCEETTTLEERLCCCGVPWEISEQEDGCITLHPVFDSLCCAPQVLQAVFLEFLNGVDGERDDDLNRQYRYVAYRLFTRWIWGTLGIGNRVVLPACVVARIRRQSPSASYVGFRHPPL
ncbi:uncharacterized protein LOC144114000 [Amblyomma americanum]